MQARGGSVEREQDRVLCSAKETVSNRQEPLRVVARPPEQIRWTMCKRQDIGGGHCDQCQRMHRLPRSARRGCMGERLDSMRMVLH